MPTAGRRLPGGAVPSVTELVRSWARGNPGGLAIVDASRTPARTVTWQELSLQADRIAMLLIRLGVQPGEAVALQAPNWAESVITALAVVRAGAVILPLLPGMGPRETGIALTRAGARVLVTAAAGRMAAAPVEHLVVIDRADAAGAEAADPAAASGPHVHQFTTALASQDPGAWLPAWRGPERSGQLAFTSGTTGQAKFVRHGADVLTRAALLVAGRLRITAADRVQVPCPLGHHSGFLYGMWLAWVTGAAQIVHGKWDAQVALTTLATWNGTFAQLAPAMLADLCVAVERGAQAPPSLRLCVVTGAPVSGGQAERASRVLGTAVCRAWGSTETCMGTLSEPDDPADQRWSTDGRPLDGVRLRVTGAAGEPLVAPAEGNLQVSSACQFSGYGTGPEFERAAFTPDGWYRTGDLAAIDESGYLRITGRITDVINRGGQKIPAALIEGLLADHPAVADVAIAPTHDPRLGERACAFVVAAGGQRVTLGDLQRHLDLQGVTRHYWPEQLELLTRLPRNAAGKVQKRQLRPRSLGGVPGAPPARQLSTFGERDGPGHA